MGSKVSLTAADGHDFSAYRAEPKGARRGAVVVIQEIFGVNNHIRSVTDRVAGLGYAAIAPQVFDRFARDFESGYSPDEITHCRSLLSKVDWDAFMRDVEAARASVAGADRMGIVGFCMGGSVSFLAACRLAGLDASVCYYGGRIVDFASETPRCPVQMHFGELDESIPLANVDKIRALRPEAEIFVYPDAKHGFHCDERGSFQAEASSLAWSRTTEFLKTHIG